MVNGSPLVGAKEFEVINHLFSGNALCMVNGGGTLILPGFVRATLGRRRAILFAVPAVILIAVTLILRASHPAGAQWQDTVLGDFGFSVLLPLTALIVGTGVLGAEIDDGSAIHLLATPVRRASIVFTKFAVAQQGQYSSGPAF